VLIAIVRAAPPFFEIAFDQTSEGRPRSDQQETDVLRFNNFMTSSAKGVMISENFRQRAVIFIAKYITSSKIHSIQNIFCEQLGYGFRKRAGGRRPVSSSN
jgi:hypothetical protein